MVVAANGTATATTRKRLTGAGTLRLRPAIREVDRAVAAERERWGRRVECYCHMAAAMGAETGASAGAWLYPDDVLAVMRA